MSYSFSADILAALQQTSFATGRPDNPDKVAIRMGSGNGIAIRFRLKPIARTIKALPIGSELDCVDFPRTNHSPPMFHPFSRSMKNFK